MKIELESSFKSKAHHIGTFLSLRKECKEEIEELLKKGFIKKNSTSYSCATFYVNKRLEQIRGNKRLVINYKPLNEHVKSVQHPIPSKDEVLRRIESTNVFF